LTMPGKIIGPGFLCAAVLLMVTWSLSAGHEGYLPQFGKDTVLVWEIPRQGFTSNFVVRIASYSPALLMEWEDSQSQGTVFIPMKEMMEAKGYVNTRLFKPGMDTRARDETTVWLSRRAYRDLKEKKEVLELRIKNLQKQEDAIKDKAEKLQADVMKKLQEKK